MLHVCSFEFFFNKILPIMEKIPLLGKILIKFMEKVFIEKMSDGVFFNLCRDCENNDKNLQKKVEIALECGANPNASMTGGRTVLMEAASKGRYELVRLLTAHNVNVNKHDINHNTALMEAAKNGYSKTVDELLKANPRLDTIHSPDGMTALFYAVKNAVCEKQVGDRNYDKVVNLLLNANAKKNVNGKKAKSFIHQTNSVLYPATVRRLQ